MGHLSRRRFLKIAGFGAGAAALATGGVHSLQAMAGKPAAGSTATVPTFCDVCFWKCGAIATSATARLWKIEGNPDDPLSRGRLCPRGTGGVGAHYDTDRLQRAADPPHEAAATTSGPRSPGTRRSATSPTSMQAIKRHATAPRPSRCSRTASAATSSSTR